MACPPTFSGNMVVGVCGWRVVLVACLAGIPPASWVPTARAAITVPARPDIPPNVPPNVVALEPPQLYLHYLPLG